MIKKLILFLTCLLMGSSIFAANIPDDGRLTSQWPPVAPETIEGISPLSGLNQLLVEGRPEVTMLEAWKAEIKFTTAKPVPAVSVIVYYGQYDEVGTLFPRARFSRAAYEAKLDTDTLDSQYTTEHSVILDLSKLIKVSADINQMAAANGGVIGYRIELNNSYGNGPTETKAARLHEWRFEFYNGQIVPTIIEGPFVDQITDTSAIISWDTDAPVNGMVEIAGGQSFAAAAENTTHFEVPLTGLAPNSTHHYTVKITDGNNNTASRQFYFKTPASHTTKFTFAVLGDSREDFGGGERQLNGVNGYVMERLTISAFNNNAEFILHTGDMVNGYTDSVLDFEMQLESYKDSVENVGHYLPIYEMMGNHEVSVNAYKVADGAVDSRGETINVLGKNFLMFDLEGDSSGEAVFRREFVNPDNGPEPDNAAANAPAGKSLPPYKESVYYFDYGNSRFIVMNNNYWYSSYPELLGGNLEGYIMDDQTQWLLDLFEQTGADSSISYVFLFAQEPMFPNGGQTKNSMWHYGGVPEKNFGWDRSHVIERRDEIWRAFVGTGKAISANFGDEHNYSRTLIKKDKDGNAFDYPVWQMISGGAGAPYSAQFNTDLPWSEDVVRTSTQLNYTLYSIDGPTVKYEVFNIDGQVIDSKVLTLTHDPIVSSNPTIGKQMMISSAGLIDVGGHEQSIEQASFQGSIIAENGEIAVGKEVKIQFNILPTPEDIGQTVGLEVVALDPEMNAHYFNGVYWQVWNGGALEIFATVDSLPQILDVSANFALNSAGQYEFYIGYRRADGSTIYNRDPVRLIVK